LQKVTCKVEFRSVFRASTWNFKILVIPNVLALVKSYEHGFVKKRDGYKLYAKSPAKSSFDRFFVHHFEILKYWPFPMYHGMLYENGFPKKCDSHKHCSKSSFDRFFVHHLGISKYWSFRTC
ncbi:hypothetical protein B296_00015384, partial [Ensete ventricosum]